MDTFECLSNKASMLTLLVLPFDVVCNLTFVFDPSGPACSSRRGGAHLWGAWCGVASLFLFCLIVINLRNCLIIKRTSLDFTWIYNL